MHFNIYLDDSTGQQLNAMALQVGGGAAMRCGAPQGHFCAACLTRSTSATLATIL